MNDDPAIGALVLVHKAVAGLCSSHPFATSSEGTVKAAVLKELLLAGYTVLEGSSRGAKTLSYANGTVQVALAGKVPRMAATANSGKTKNSPDIRIWSPARMVVELQVRSTLSSQDALFSGNILDDLDRVRSRTADLFVLAADRQIYDALRGEKTETRGRKAANPALLKALFPSSGSLTSVGGFHTYHDGDTCFRTFASRPEPVWGIERVVVLVMNASPPTQAAV
jgi:hypothetical protein